MPFTIHANFESILVPEDNEKQNPKESYTNKYQKHIACSYGYKWLCIGHKFSKPFKPYLGRDALYKSTKCWICDNWCINNDVIVRDHCHIAGKYSDSAQRDCNINLKLSHKFPSCFITYKNMIPILSCKN